MSDTFEYVINYLENLSSKPQNMNVGGWMNNAYREASSSNYNLSILKVLERGVFKEVEALYEILRDLMLAFEFIGENSPSIMLYKE